MEFFHKLYDLLRHLGDDAKWQAMIDYIGTGNLYIVLFAIVFCETGLVITPFLPGDSLLFAAGALAARGVGLSLPMVFVLMLVAAILGDACNYWIGHKLGPAVFNREDSKLLNKKHLQRAQEFYEKYGGKTIILARFVPIVRTFAPFVAGIGRMNFFYFWVYNIVGAVAWVTLCVGAGWLFGGMEFVQKNFEVVIVAIVVISILPMVVEYIRSRRSSSNRSDSSAEAATTGAVAGEHVERI
ncbi:MAG: DedA family protein [Phycisphaerales bacterium]|nr:DedA family protein [Phycisphaerales bacterium]